MPENDINGMRPKEDEREYLRKLIAEWNASRMDLFAISEPGEVSSCLTYLLFVKYLILVNFSGIPEDIFAWS